MFRRYRPYRKGEFYLVAADTSAGGGDFCAAQFLSKTHLDVPSVYHSPDTATSMTPLIHEELEQIFDITGVKPVVAYERANGGAFEMDRLASLNRLGKYTIFVMPGYGQVENVESKKLGWDTNTATRPNMQKELKDAIDNQLITLYDKPTISELFSFIVVQTSSSWKAQAEKNAHDDLVMALAIAWQMYQICETPEEPIKNDDFPEDNLFQGGWY